MFKHFIVITLLSTLIACGGGSNSDSSPEPEPIPSTPSTPEPDLPSQDQSARFLNQATFGATVASIEQVSQLGYEAWIEQQILLTTSSHVEYLEALAPTLNLAPDEELQRQHRMEAWFTHAITAPDQLRQRVAFALSEILVVSEHSNFGDDIYGLANYYDLLLNNAFGNYRDLLEQVTLSPIMGMYLSMLGNEKPNDDENIRPDENYARELMQLFSIGLVELNLDGSNKLSSGNTTNTYDQATIKAFAHVYTGWNFNGVTADNWYQFYDNYNAIEPMTAVAEFHDRGEKLLLNGFVIPANQTPEQDLTMALDNIFNHPNVGPFISKQLIKKLVTSNPSPEYIARVASAFNDNGQGVRGELSAVIKAILLDQEALLGVTNKSSFGKIREPLISAVHLWRAFDASSPNERFQFGWPDYFFAQAPLAANHVFNFFSPNYAPPGVINDNNLIAPELEIITENYLTRTSNFFAYSTLWGHTDFDDENTKDTRILISLATLKPLANDIDALLAHLNMLLMGGTMSDEMHAILTDTYQATSNDDENSRLSNLLFLIMVSPQYTVQK
jgi:uncharacterized protein (DUF1800 family)